MSSDVPELVAKILERRGVFAADYDAFFSPSVRDLAAPDELPGAVEAAEALVAAARAGKRIVVFGDYDCDGVCATAILVKALSAIGAEVSPFLPERLSEGYGMSDASVERMLAANPGVGLVVTVDNGINSVEQVASLRARGVDVIVTDHHLPGEELPDCAAVVNPKVSHPGRLEDLCGAIWSCLTLDAATVDDVFNVGAAEYTTMREDYQAVLDRAGFGKKIVGLPAKPVIWTLRFLEKLHLSPLYMWVYETACTDSFVSIDKAREKIGFAPKFSNKQALVRNYDWYVEHLADFKGKSGVSHRVPWKQGILALAKAFF